VKHTIKFLAITTASVVVAMLCIGCSTGPKHTGPKYFPDWAYAPESLIVHQLSRVVNPVNSGESSEVVVHIKFLDGDGFACRGMGLLTLTMQNDGDAVNPAIDSVDLNDDTQNRSHFDPVTRTYVVRFKMDLPKSVHRLDIKAALGKVRGRGSISVRRNSVKQISED